MDEADFGTLEEEEERVSECFGCGAGLGIEEVLVRGGVVLEEEEDDEGGVSDFVYVSMIFCGETKEKL